jgi:hypothetical protein
MVPRFEADTDGRFKQTHVIDVRGLGTDQRSVNIHPLNVGIINHGRTLGQDCELFVDVLKPEEELLHPVRWEDPSSGGKAFDTPFVQSMIDSLPSKVDVQVGPGRIAVIGLATDYTKKLDLASTRRLTLDIPGTTDITLKIVGSNFASQELGRFRITTRSWNDMDLSKVTITTRLHDFVRRKRETVTR